LEGDLEMNTLRATSVAAMVLLMALPTAPALAQTLPDSSGSPVYGSVKLAAGFTPDPHVIEMLAGGDIDASPLGANCVGYVGRAPDYQIEYEAGSLSLSFTVNGPVDTSLIINGPSGQWMCDDDSAGNLDPLVTVLEPRSGRYDIWVGTMSRGVTSEQRVSLKVTELGNLGAQEERPDLSGDPVYGSATLRAGFTPDPHRLELVPGGTVNAATVSDRCIGLIGSRSDYQIHYTGGSMPLTFRVTGKIDTSLVINGPNGRWHCDDDSGGNLDPRLTFKAPESGRYDIWVGKIAEGAEGTAILTISEID
jgi:hypothetical protein